MFEDYDSFKTDVLSLTKIDLNCYKEKQMKRRIDALIATHNITSYSDYVRALRSSRDMFQEFVNYLTINVSEFYRNPELWKVLSEEIVPILLEHGKYLKIWSAACSTGDEPYSLVMMLNQFLPLANIRILATDIDKQVMEKAKLGIYSDKSLKGLPPGFLTKYFTKISDNTYQIHADVKKCVEFKEHNLLRDPYPAECDLIVCRNVMIYFTEEAKAEIYRKFNNALKDYGILFVGSTEQMIQPGNLGFRAVRPFFYKKYFE